MLLIQRNDVIEHLAATFPTQRSAIPFCHGLRTLVRIGLDATGLEKPEYIAAELGVTVEQDVR